MIFELEKWDGLIESRQRRCGLDANIRAAIRLPVGGHALVIVTE